ncbi:MAG: sulfatase [Porticoccaceae bacterium]|nr:sulfatase [Porticoccaceae bacterium]
MWKCGIFVIIFTATCQTLIAAERPNFVWLTSEDNSADYLRLYSPQGAATPNIEKLAQHGLVFDNAFSNAPVCSVARTTLLTGMHLPALGVQNHRASFRPHLPKGVRMYPWYLQQAGYYTSNNAKTDYNLSIATSGWDDSSGQASWRNRKPEQAFFHVQNFDRTHEGKLHFSRQQIESHPLPLQSTAPLPYHPDTPVFRYTRARYLELHREMDKQIGALLKQLQDDRLLDDTFVFYFGDHGGVLPGSKGYIYQAGTRVPLVIHIPKNWQHLVDLTVGSRVSGQVNFVDFAPTLLHLAGVEIPAHMQGTPFLGKGISAEAVARRDESFAYADRFDEKYDLSRALRKGRYRYIRSYQPFNVDGLHNNYRYRMLAYREWRQLFDAGKLNPAQRRFFEARPAEALYDLEADPHELYNLAANPDYRETLVAMRQRLQDKVKSLPDLGFLPENLMVETLAAGTDARFDEANRKRIARLIDIADLSLLPFKKARPQIKKALKSTDPLARYWGLITCSSFGQQATGFAATARRLAARDGDNLVRVRAAEFLALIGKGNPAPVIEEVLNSTDNEFEAALALNTVVLLRDFHGYEFTISADMFPGEWLSDKKSNVKRRVDYLTN